MGHVADTDSNSPPFNAPGYVKCKEEIEAILDDQLLSTQQGGYQKFLVKWCNHPLSDCWLLTEEVQQLRSDLYDLYSF